MAQERVGSSFVLTSRSVQGCASQATGLSSADRTEAKGREMERVKGARDGEWEGKWGGEERKGETGPGSSTQPEVAQISGLKRSLCMDGSLLSATR